jgi:type II secretory pathway pseudopilin PulG
MLLAVLAMLAITIAFLGATANNSSAKLERRDITAAALAQAKAALLAYTIARDDGSAGSRPGEFPCPTMVAPGTATYGVAATGCATRRIGRLPWQSLGIQELFDDSGEPLWYALSTKFNPTVTYINSSSKGDITIFSADGVTAQQAEVVAVIFSAGAALSNQTRLATASAPCAATLGTTIARNTCADNYLDASSGRNNASNAGPFIAATPSNNFNDALVYITTQDFIPRIEDRIAKALVRTVNSYYTQYGYYPYAAYYSDAVDPLPKNRAICATNTYSGRFPETVSQGGSTPILPRLPCLGLQEWQDVPAVDRLPAWFFANEWYLSVYYSVGKAYVKNGLKTCLLPGDCLSVDGDTSVQAVLMLPGTMLPNQTRISNSLMDYFEITENLEGWPFPSNYSYTSAALNIPTRDRVIAIKN